MGKRTLEDRIAELEARFEPPSSADVESEPQPMRKAYQVVSALTGAVVGQHDKRSDAEAEVERLNEECKREGVKHLGESMRYKVTSVDVVDLDEVASDA